MQCMSCSSSSRLLRQVTTRRLYSTYDFSQDQIESVRTILSRKQKRKIQYDELATLGSTQTRDTTFQPHHALHRPESPTSLSLSHLIASAAHLGHAKELSHPAAYSNIYGTRNGISIIDVRETLTALRRAAQVVKKVVEDDGIVLFLGSPGRGIDRAVEENAKRLEANGFGVVRWQAGTISNAARVFNASTLAISNRTSEQVTPYSFLPSLVILLSPTTTQHALREVTAANIPTIGIVDTNVDPRVVTYPIPANDDSPRAVELIAGVLGVAGKQGLLNRRDSFKASFSPSPVLGGANEQP